MLQAQDFVTELHTDPEGYESDIQWEAGSEGDDAEMYEEDGEEEGGHDPPDGSSGRSPGDVDGGSDDAGGGSGSFEAALGGSGASPGMRSPSSRTVPSRAGGARRRSKRVHLGSSDEEEALEVRRPLGNLGRSGSAGKGGSARGDGPGALHNNTAPAVPVAGSRTGPHQADIRGYCVPLTLQLVFETGLHPSTLIPAPGAPPVAVAHAGFAAEAGAASVIAAPEAAAGAAAAPGVAAAEAAGGSARGANMEAAAEQGLHASVCRGSHGPPILKGLPEEQALPTGLACPTLPAPTPVGPSSAGWHQSSSAMASSTALSSTAPDPAVWRGTFQCSSGGALSAAAAEPDVDLLCDCGQLCERVFLGPNRMLYR